MAAMTHLDQLGIRRPSIVDSDRTAVSRAGLRQATVDRRRRRGGRLLGERREVRASGLGRTHTSGEL